MKQKVSALQRALNLWAIILFVWGIYRYYFKTDLPIWVDEFIAKPIVFIVPVYVYITKFEKRDFLSGIEFRLDGLKTDLLLGVGIGVIFFFAGALGNIDKLPKLFTASFFSHWSLWLTILTALATSISEEILSRGFILKRLFEDSKNVLSASFLASILFFFLHIPILFTSSQYQGNILLQVMVTDVILSLAVSFIFLQRRSIMLPILIHAFYTISLYLFQVGLS